MGIFSVHTAIKDDILVFIFGFRPDFAFTKVCCIAVIQLV